MYTLYQQKIKSAFAGNGIETLVCKNGVIVAHLRGWDNPQVVDHFPNKVALVGNAESRRGKGWRRLTGERARNAQAWAADVVRQ
jgi:hypothetical protein